MLNILKLLPAKPKNTSEIFFKVAIGITHSESKQRTKMTFEMCDFFLLKVCLGGGFK